MREHGYRISDASSASRSGKRILGTSFCWRGEGGRCDLEANGRSKPRLLCLHLGPTTLTVAAELSLPLEVIGGDEEFNVEGIVNYGDGVLIVNDNVPGSTQTTLRYLAHEKIGKFRNDCLER